MSDNKDHIIRILMEIIHDTHDMPFEDLQHLVAQKGYCLACEHSIQHCDCADDQDEDEEENDDED
jgi:hypothetical protein